MTAQLGLCGQLLPSCQHPQGCIPWIPLGHAAVHAPYAWASDSERKDAIHDVITCMLKCAHLMKKNKKPHQGKPRKLQRVHDANQRQLHKDPYTTCV
mgnify:CR=1 FL=1